MSSNVTRRAAIKAGVATVGAIAFARPVWAQAWPSKPIRIIVSSPAAGLTDLLARAYGEYISQALGQSVVIENRTGAGGIIGAQALKTAPADGYTLMFTISTTMIMNRALYKNLPYDPDKDFVLISSMSPGPLPFVAHQSTGATNLGEFAEHARRNAVTYGTYAAGSYAHIAMVELNKHFGINVEIVHYRGESPMWQDFNAGIIQAASGSYNGSSNVLRTGIGRAIAMWPKRSKKLPAVATFLEQGVSSKVFHLKGFICLVGPAGMPDEIVERLSALMVEGGKSRRVQKLLDTFGIDEAAEGRAAFRKLYDQEKPVWIELVRNLGLTSY